MFSVDNFYEFLNSHYGWDKTNIMPWKFKVHGSRDFKNLQACYNNREFHSRLYYWGTGGSMILHDQEPFSANLLDTYKHTRYIQKNHAMWQEMSRQEFLLIDPMYTCSWPIFCHSEHNSRDIKYVQHTGMVDCYYFWHGLVARDWFRHWKHHADIVAPRRDWHKRFLLYARDHTGTREYRQQLVTELQHMQDQVEYNWSGIEQVDSDHSAKINVEDAVNTAVHLVAETIYDQKKVHLTEKIFKPIVMNQPFVVFAGAGALQYLKSYGFRTFDSVWDESYDQATDHDERFNKIMSVIKTLHTQTPEQFANTMQQCQAIVEHNRQHFFSETFEQIMLDEFHRNMVTSIDQQRRLTVEDPGGSLFHHANALKQRNVKLNWVLASRITGTARRMKQHQPERYQLIRKQYPWLPA